MDLTPSQFNRFFEGAIAEAEQTGGSMESPEVEVVQNAVDSITTVMKYGRFTRKDLEMIRKIFEKGIEVTNKAIERGPK